MIIEGTTKLGGDLALYRSIKDGGSQFRASYLARFSTREKEEDYATRLSMSPIPGTARQLINELKNQIIPRLSTITREGGPSSYRKCANGEKYGMDGDGSSMLHLLDKYILPELLFMGKVGILVVSPNQPTEVLTKASIVRPPLLRIFPIETIRDYKYARSDQKGQLSHVSLAYLNESGQRAIMEYRLDDDGGVYRKDFKKQPEYRTDLDQIPFVLAELNESLLVDIAYHQVANLNMSSSDVNFVVHSNFPIYTEKTDPRTAPSHLIQGGEGTKTEHTAEMGTLVGRTYTDERPGFIAPPTEPLLASMKKQKELKDEMREMLNLTLNNTKSVSAEAKGKDSESMEAGLSSIGQELAWLEQHIANIWAELEGESEVTKVTYPSIYRIKTDAERVAEALELAKMRNHVPSDTFRKQISKMIVETMLKGKVLEELIEAIYAEVDASTITLTNPDDVFKAVEASILDARNAAIALGTPVDGVAKAQLEHAERLARISLYQQKNNTAVTSDTSTPDINKDAKEVSQHPDLNKDKETPQ